MVTQLVAYMEKEVAYEILCFLKARCFGYFHWQVQQPQLLFAYLFVVFPFCFSNIPKWGAAKIFGSTIKVIFTNQAVSFISNFWKTLPLLVNSDKCNAVRLYDCYNNSVSLKITFSGK